MPEWMTTRISGRTIGLTLLTLGALLALLVVLPRAIAGFSMGDATTCISTDDTDGCLEQVDARVQEHEEAGTFGLMPVDWRLRTPDGTETLNLTRRDEDLPEGRKVTLLLWDGDAVAVRSGPDEVHGLAWGVNRWILWAMGALALAVAGVAALVEDRRGGRPWVAVALQSALAGVAAMLLFPAYSIGAATGALLVLIVWSWFAGAAVLMGTQRRVEPSLPDTA